MLLIAGLSVHRAALEANFRVLPDRTGLAFSNYAPAYLWPIIAREMRYLVKGRLMPGKEVEFLRAVDEGTLGRGSIAGDEYLQDMDQARVGDDGEVHWVEVCFCTIPLAEERPYWEKYFELLSVTDAHSRGNCRDLNGTEPWACCDCDCTKKLEERLAQKWDAFLPKLRERAM